MYKFNNYETKLYHHRHGRQPGTFLPPEVLRHIREGKVFSGGLRHREIVEKLLPEGAEWISITVPLDNVFAQYENIFADFEKKASDASIVVFASGDPCFSASPIR